MTRMRIYCVALAVSLCGAAVFVACEKKSDSNSGGGGGGTKIIFVTSLQYNANLGGLSGADAKCALRGTAGGFSGTWKAWLSDSSTNAIDRIADVGPWVDTKGHLLFQNKAGMTGVPVTGIAYDENGNQHSGDNVITGTVTGGTKSSAVCSDWSSTSGAVQAGYSDDSAHWTDNQNSASCIWPQRLYCVQQ